MTSNVLAPGAHNAPSSAAAYTTFLLLGAGFLLFRTQSRRRSGATATHGRRRRRTSRSARASSGGARADNAPAAAEDPRAVQLLATAQAEGARARESASRELFATPLGAHMRARHLPHLVLTTPRPPCPLVAQS
jgi:hypothetical protein